MEFMHEGGYAMWVILAIGAGTAVGAVARRLRDGDVIAGAGAFGCLVMGVLGTAQGMARTVEYLDGVEQPEQAHVLALGIGESINNAQFGASLAFVLGILTLFLWQARAKAKRGS